MSNSPTNGSVSGGGGTGANGGAQYGASLGGLGSTGAGAGSAASTMSQLGNLGNVSTMQQLLAASQNPVGGQHQMFDTPGESSSVERGSYLQCNRERWIFNPLWTKFFFFLSFFGT